MPQSNPSPRVSVADLTDCITSPLYCPYDLLAVCAHEFYDGAWANVVGLSAVKRQYILYVYIVFGSWVSLRMATQAVRKAAGCESVWLAGPSCFRISILFEISWEGGNPRGKNKNLLYGPFCQLMCHWAYFRNSNRRLPINDHRWFFRLIICFLITLLLSPIKSIRSQIFTIFELIFSVAMHMGEAAGLVPQGKCVKLLRPKHVKAFTTRLRSTQFVGKWLVILRHSFPCPVKNSA